MPESSEPNVVRVPELGLTTQLMNELRELISANKYDELTVAELTGVLELIKLEYAMNWVRS